MATAGWWWCTAVLLEQELLGIGCNFDGARTAMSRAGPKTHPRMQCDQVKQMYQYRVPLSHVPACEQSSVAMQNGK
ncbi:hypothetical protein SNOG_04655 [Parastagonospora nodorum SN15]|uniref:Secreted protein n=1 Tax=Phaeosphaeria nodorum (strain SN15 / ATCC MYA-4574 / FGSC 10173) TaxID=321614 RepID=Q0UUA9_PHANO|nr:hypothetical protein SNOG_04655 [Parastagonospora nodorum SN15]EAT88415.1 hypothetical protein SNOG_04655 [Parastagonospora nodorum SN15]